MADVSYQLLARWVESQVIESAARKLALKPASIRLLREMAPSDETRTDAPRLIALPSLDDR